MMATQNIHLTFSLAITNKPLEPGMQNSVLIIHIHIQLETW